MEKGTKSFDWEKELMEINANMDKLFPPEENIKVNEDLLMAVRRNQLEKTLKCLEAGGKVSHQSQGLKRSPLHCAVMNANIHMAKVLIEHGAEIDMQGKYGTPINDLLSDRHWYDLNPTLPQKINMIKFLFAAGAKIDVNYRDRNGDTYLHKAIETGSLELVKLILEQPGGEQLLPTRNHDGSTIVMACTLRNRLVILKYISSLPGDSVNQQLAVNGKCTAQIACSAYNKLHCLNRLPPLPYAILLGHTDVALYIIDLIVSLGPQSKVKLNSRFTRGCTALHIAAWMCDVDAIAALLPHDNIDIEEKNLLDNYDPSDFIFLFRGPTDMYDKGKMMRCIEIVVQANADTSGQSSPGGRPPLIQLSIRRRLADSSKFLILAGTPMDHLKDGRSDAIIDIEDNDLCRWIFEFYRNARSLKDLCRIRVRRQLGKEIRFILPQMQLPTSIKEYLMLGDLCFVELNQ